MEKKTNKQLIDSDLATDGVFPKAWYRDGFGFTLYKGDRNNSVTKEVRASYKELGIELSYVNATDDYSKFVNDRIRILRS